jgi:hypothetical protein
MPKEQAEAVPWTPEDDLKLRTSLEEGEGRISWTEIARRAFPDGEHDKADCTEVCSAPWSQGTRRLQQES